jgi:hypothetical protein
MPTENDKRRERAEAALRAVPTHYAQNEEGITDAITDLTHLAAARGADIDALLDRCRGNFEAEAAAAGERPPSRYAILVVVEAVSPEAAWDAIQGTAGALEGDGEPDCVYVGAPWRGVPADAEDLGTESIRIGMSLPDRDGEGFVAATRELRPCE